MVGIDIPPEMVEVRHTRPPLKALTSIRFFAAIYVVLFHQHVGFQVSRIPLVASFMASGYTGVTLFFVLSGFILAYNYPEVRNAKEFWIARFARIYPVYALSLLLSLMRPVEWHQPNLFAGCILDFGLLQAWCIPLYGIINSVAWTLSVEAFFYAMFPLLLPLLRKMPRRVFGQVQGAYFLFVCLPVLLHFSRFAHQGMGLANLIEGPFPLFRLNTFAVGVFAGARSFNRVRGERGKLRLAIAILCSVGLLCAAPSTIFLPLRTLLLTYAFLGVIVELKDVMWPALTNHWMQVAGEISYGIYILQAPIGFAASGLWRRLVSSTANPVFVEVTAIIVAAYISFRWFETPARLTIRKALTGRAVPVRPI